MSLALPGFFRTLGFNVLQLGPAAAYSLRSLDPALDPTVVNVRRSNDNSTSDFTASEVSDGTLASWVGGGNDGYVVTWYDQSGNSEDATQASSGSQPKIVNSGTLVTEGGKPALSFDGTNDRSMNSSLPASSTKSVFYVKKGANLDGNSVVLSFPATTNQVGIYYFATTPYEYGFNTWAGDCWGYSGGDTEFLSHTIEMALFKDGDPAVNGCKLYINGAEKTLSQVKGNSANRTMANGFRIGAGQNTSNQDYDGTQQEIIIYSSDQSANRVAIENNINGHFGIY